MRFAIYDAPAGGNKMWPSTAHEQHSAVPVTNGLFSLQLGSVADPMTANAFSDGGDRYLHIWVCTTARADCNTYDNMGRLPISSSAYALYSTSSASAEALRGRTVSAASPSTGQVLRWSGSQWAPAAANLDNHLGQTWTGLNRPLVITGTYSALPLTTGAPAGAPLVVSNVLTTGMGVRVLNATYVVYTLTRPSGTASGLARLAFMASCPTATT